MSAVYFFKNKKLHFQTKDHSLSQISVEMGRIPLRDIRSDKDQNKLTRVLGSDYYIPPDCDIYHATVVHDERILWLRSFSSTTQLCADCM